jgi:hypothetical protein
MRAVAAVAVANGLMAAGLIKSAAQLTIRETLRIGSAAERRDRARHFGSQSMSLPELVSWTQQRQRARQTHRGKR